MPWIFFAGRVSMNAATMAGLTVCWPLGLRRSLAILASILLGAIPAEAVRPVVSKMRARISRAISVAGRGRWETSR